MKKLFTNFKPSTSFVAALILISLITFPVFALPGDQPPKGVVDAQFNSLRTDNANGDGGYFVGKDYGVRGYANANNDISSGVYAEGKKFGIKAEATGIKSYGGFFEGTLYGVAGSANGDDSRGISGTATGQNSVGGMFNGDFYGLSSYSVTGLGGLFSGFETGLKANATDLVNGIAGIFDGYAKGLEVGTNAVSSIGIDTYTPKDWSTGMKINAPGSSSTGIKIDASGPGGTGVKVNALGLGGIGGEFDGARGIRVKSTAPPGQGEAGRFTGSDGAIVILGNGGGYHGAIDARGEIGNDGFTIKADGTLDASGPNAVRVSDPSGLEVDGSIRSKGGFGRIYMKKGVAKTLGAGYSQLNQVSCDGPADRALSCSFLAGSEVTMADSYFSDFGQPTPTKCNMYVKNFGAIQDITPVVVCFDPNGTW